MVPAVPAQERIRLLQLLVSSHCPMQVSALSPPHYDRVVFFVCAAIQVALPPAKVPPTPTLPHLPSRG